MARNYDRTDLLWTSRGDYFIADGDLRDTFSDPLRSLWQECRTRIEANQGDWIVYPNTGANIGDFVGEPNNKETAESIKTRITASLCADSFIHSKDLKIQYAPIARDKLMFRLSISVAPTTANGSSDTLTKTLLYNYSDNNVYFMGV